MADEDDKNNEKEKGNPQNTGVTEEQIKKRIDDAVAEAVKDIKAKLNNAFTERDAALEKVKALEKQLGEIEVERLKDAGKVKEALELELKQEKERAEKLAKENTELTRDNTLKGALAGFNFTGDKAHKMMFRDIVKELVRDESNGEWKHRSGSSISDYVKLYAESEENAFLFKKENSSGPKLPKQKLGPGKQTKLIGRPQAEVLKDIQDGVLTRKGR